MFRTRRTVLVRRLWRSRAITAGNDGGADDRSNPEKIPRTEHAPENTGTRVGGSGEAGVEGRTVTCCLFKDLPRGKHRFACNRHHDTSERKNATEQELKRCTHAFLKKLKEKPLDVLVEAVESHGGMPSACVLASQTEVRIGGQLVSPKYLLCRLFRWPDLRLSSVLKPLCFCQSFRSEDSQTVSCCNPYHYSLLCGPLKDGKGAVFSND